MNPTLEEYKQAQEVILAYENNCKKNDEVKLVELKKDLLDYFKDNTFGGYKVKDIYFKPNAGWYNRFVGEQNYEITFIFDLTEDEWEDCEFYDGSLDN